MNQQEYVDHWAHCQRLKGRRISPATSMHLTPDRIEQLEARLVEEPMTLAELATELNAGLPR